MTMAKKYNVYVINALLAVVVSLVVNFSYILAIRQQEYRDQNDPNEETLHSGTLHISKDGYAYIVGEAETPKDSIYVTWWQINRLGLTDGSRMTVMARESRVEGGNKVLAFVKEIDGQTFDYAAAYNRPSDNLLFGLQFAYYLLLTFVLLSIMTLGGARNTSIRFYLKRAGVAVVAAVALYFLMPVIKFRSDDIVLNFLNTRGGGLVVDSVAILKCSFVLLFALLYARTYQLIYQKEDIMLENELLKNENLKARYNTLINQINPHFLFNSLSSLSALVREGKNGDAVSYIDRLSDTFRYTIQNEPHTTTTLREELEFAAAYKYLLEVRYDEKLFVDIDVEQDKMEWLLPTFSIQPLIENAVKHNAITRARPLRISIRTEGDYLVVSNAINPKLAPEEGTGIGLGNLANRWQLLTGKAIEITNDGTTFTVRLPFITA
ncbi:MAG: histidine kinase [Rikenellaceae bacterium]|nr:histidine kinase [Rikenellaceae bacterium]